MSDWYVYLHNGAYFTVDTEDGKPVRSGPSTARDIAQATLRGKFRNLGAALADLERLEQS